MAQLSRPFQVALVAVVLLAGVWLFALQGHSTTTSGSGASAPVTPSAPSSTPAASGSSASTAEAQAKAAAPSHVYTGPVPGLQGLTRDINKAHGAVAASQHQAQELDNKSQQASNEASSSPAAAAPTAAPSTSRAGSSAAAVAAGKATTHVTTRAAPTSTGTLHKSPSASRSPAPARGSSSVTAPSGQRAVEADLAKGDVVLLLFWDPKGADDVAVHRAVQAVRSSGHHKVAVQEAAANKVAQFGSVTRGVQVYATPTLFVINAHGHAIVLTGLQDSFTIGQAVEEARQT